MNEFMERLNRRFKLMIEAKWFNYVMDSLIYLNPIALAPQVIAVFTAPGIEGVSLGMWYMFAAMQTAFVFNGIKTKTFSVFLSMSISVIESITIIAVVYIRN